MARCVYTVKFGLTVGDSVVLMVQGGYVSTGGPKHGCGSAWNLSERPTLSDRAKHRPDGAFRRAGWVTEVQSRSDAEARGAAAYVRTPCLQNPCLGKRWPVAHQIGAAEAEAGTAPPRELKGDRKTNKDKERNGKKARIVLINNRTGGFVWCKCALKWVPISCLQESSSSVSPELLIPPPTVPLTPAPKCLGWTSLKCFTPPH